MASKEVRILVVSDSHGDRRIVEELKQRYQGQVDALFHNGDSELAENEVDWQPMLVVRGNCDYEEAYPENRVTEIGGVTIAQTHGHLYGINYSWRWIERWAQEVGADICLYGHLHVPDAQMREGVLFVNPGSICQPRGSIKERLYALVTITEEAFHIDYYTREHQLYPELTKDFHR